MGLNDDDFKNNEDRETYQLGDIYRRMAKTDGWKDLKKDIEISIKNKIAEFEFCKVESILYNRGIIAGYRDILNKVEHNVSAAREIEEEIKGINNEEEDDDENG